MKAGASKQVTVKPVTVKPEDAYGPLHTEAFSKTKKEQLPQDALTAGATLQGLSANSKIILTCSKIN